MKTTTAAAESASAMVALPGGPSGATMLAPQEALRWEVNVWMTKGPQKISFRLIYNAMHSEIYNREPEKTYLALFLLNTSIEESIIFKALGSEYLTGIARIVVLDIIFKEFLDNCKGGGSDSSPPFTYTLVGL